MVLIILLIALVLIYSTILLFLNSSLKNLNPCKNKKKRPVSVIVAAYNEEQNIRPCIMAIINQNYRADLYEIIVVDDQSTDNTYSILQDIRRSYPQLKIVQIQRSLQNLYTVAKSSKKIALSTAMSYAKHDLILLTDADCIPPQQWIRATVSCFDKKVGFVAGFSPLIDPENSLLGKLVQLDSLVAASFAAAGISRNFPITCTGRNIAYRKSAFNEVNGFTDILKSLSGDDDLFMHLINQKTDWKIKYNVSPHSVVPSLQTKTISQLLTQKKRHISAGKYFPLSLKIFYAVMHLTNFGCYLFLVISLIMGFYQVFALTLFFTKILLNYLFLRTGARTFKMTHFLKFYFLWEIYSLFYNLISGPRALFGKIVWEQE